MSSLPNATSPAPLPATWTDRLFSRFVAIYGAQKTQAMWAGADMAEVKALWGDQLGRYKSESIAAAIQRLVESANQWPPTLPEFVELCRQCSVERVAQMQALPEPRYPKPQGYTLPDLSMNREGVDYLRWLRRVGHVSVARALPDIARTDARARAILEDHIAKDFASVVDPAAAQYLREWVATHPDWRSYCGDLSPEDRAA